MSHPDDDDLAEQIKESFFVYHDVSLSPTSVLICKAVELYMLILNVDFPDCGSGQLTCGKKVKDVVRSQIMDYTLEMGMSATESEIEEKVKETFEQFKRHLQFGKRLIKLAGGRRYNTTIGTVVELRLFLLQHLSAWNTKQDVLP